jgi:ATP-dependent Lhr-like helicase
MQKKIYDMKWDRLTPIQEMAIPAIIERRKDVIISSGTASGKTEAVFLPVITLIEKEAQSKLKVLYVSPLKALINNQFSRIEKLCEYSQINIHRWHGDIDQGKKNSFVRNPSGILQITPESIESLFINRTQYLHSFFSDVAFIIIDELHSFLDQDRGVHLRSLLSRAECYGAKKPRMIGLSATIDNFEFVKKWVNPANPDDVEIIESKGSDKELYYSLMHFPKCEDGQVPLELFEDIRGISKDCKSIIFCNSRGQVEESTVALNHLASKEGIGETYYAHHSSIDKKEREFVEKIIMDAKILKSVVATSSLELGIDIGEIELVVQVDNTFTVSSLKQRLGRSGRKRDSAQFLQLYSTQTDSLIQSIAVMELALTNWVEPARGYLAPFDILFHQILSMCHEKNGLTLEKLLKIIEQNAVFGEMAVDDVVMLIEHMATHDYLEFINGKREFIVGLKGDRLMRGKEFYSVFLSPANFEVIAGNKTIGTIDQDFPVGVGDNIILAGRFWTIRDVNIDKAKIHVAAASNAKPPRYFGGASMIHPAIHHKMMGMLCSDQRLKYLNDEGRRALEDARLPYRKSGLQPEERPIWVSRHGAVFEPFAGTIIAQTLAWMLRSLLVRVNVVDGLSRMEFQSPYDFVELFEKMRNHNWGHEQLFLFTLSNEWFQSKYNSCLPEKLRLQMHAAHKINIKGALEYLNRYTVKVIHIEV